MPIHQKLFEEIISSVLSESADSIPQCHYIVGRRGYGKTYLLLELKKRLDTAVHDNVVYVSCLFHPQLKIEDFTNSDSGKRKIWLLDDMDFMLLSLSDDTLYKLREAIYSEGGPLIIGTGAELTDKMVSYSAPLYDAFMLHTLTELDYSAGRSMVAEYRGHSDMPSDDMLKKLYSVIGCTPQTSRLIASAPGYDKEVPDIMKEILQPLGPYYKLQLISLPSIQRLIMTTLLSAGKPMMLKHIREATTMQSTEIAPVLKALAKKGYVYISDNGARKTEYSVADRLFAAWYKYCVIIEV